MRESIYRQLVRPQTPRYHWPGQNHVPYYTSAVASRNFVVVILSCLMLYICLKRLITEIMFSENSVCPICEKLEGKVIVLLTKVLKKSMELGRSMD